ncbi:MAG: hypothetical protein AVDCRST_MAG70-1946 [uncultured Thermomicrobiales bacterium]|uniref:Uncharacterized protein n=1 Tax=uncultured Thermomicrobiales bacterium TaxID=1645740 RepID=A0A6J4V0U5_9BACT|nr:MAG: hypothetical protein AVDCRST_MAG70-1946 [uncultured Thermomicrobiales bacterium]
MRAGADVSQEQASIDEMTERSPGHAMAPAHGGNAISRRRVNGDAVCYGMRPPTRSTAGPQPAQIFRAP